MASLFEHDTHMIYLSHYCLFFLVCCEIRKSGPTVVATTTTMFSHPQIGKLPRLLLLPKLPPTLIIIIILLLFEVVTLTTTEAAAAVTVLHLDFIYFSLQQTTAAAAAAVNVLPPALVAQAKRAR